MRAVRGNDDLHALADAAKIHINIVRKAWTGIGVIQFTKLHAIADALGVPFERVDSAVRVSRQQRFR